MKNAHIFSLTLVVLLFSLASCGESEEEKQARLQAYQDSLRAVEQAKVAEMMAQMQDSIDAAEAQEMPAEEEEMPMSATGMVEDGSFVVQVGAWRSQEKAQSFVDRWSDRNYPNAYVVKIGDEASGDVWFRVRVGDFTNKMEAENFGAELAREINSGYWVANKN
ncbi:MAG: SPOR domain-containing protein [Balneolaceae bacterium]|nr:SPOR domain-containing protein [Balneolaceae bacterium]